MSLVLKTSSLTKEYSEGIGAIDVNIEINSGEIVGFVGPNGAGKSTTMEMIMGFIKPNRGEIVLFDKVMGGESDFRNVKDRIGFLPSEGGLYEHLTANQLFDYASKLYRKNLTQEITTYSDRLKLDLNKKIKKLSLGNKRKVGIIQSIIHNPELVILDEPTSGLDPLIQKEILGIIKKFSEEGTAVFLSSHNLSEVESICDRVIMIKNSKIIFDSLVKEIKKKSHKIIRLINPPKIIIDRIRNIVHDENIEETDTEIKLKVTKVSLIIKVLMDYEFEDFFIERESLEDQFINLY